MANENKTKTKATLGVTGLTINAMALIAPGAFLWLTFQEQSLYGAPMAGSAMWLGLVVRSCCASPRRSAMLNSPNSIPARAPPISMPSRRSCPRPKRTDLRASTKFFTGWASHLYYWIYPGLMVGVTAILAGYLATQFWPDTFSSHVQQPVVHDSLQHRGSLLVGYIAFRGVNGSTAVNMAINIIQISALIVFTLIAIGLPPDHPTGSQGLHLSNGTPVSYNVDQINQTDDKGKPVQDTWADGSPKSDDKIERPTLQDASPPSHNGSDLAKTKNTRRGPAWASLTAMGLGAGDPYPVFQKTTRASGSWTRTATRSPIHSF